MLDYGCGNQPYRNLVQSYGGEYVPYDRAHFPANQFGDIGVEPWPGTDVFDTILCTQVLQYAPHPEDLIRAFALRGSYLVATYPTNWPEVEETDLHRFTKAGMEHMLTNNGFSVITHWRRELLHSYEYDWALGYGVVAKS